jgi:hypothetical protein
LEKALIREEKQKETIACKKKRGGRSHLFEMGTSPPFKRDCRSDGRDRRRLCYLSVPLFFFFCFLLSLLFAFFAFCFFRFLLFLLFAFCFFAFFYLVSC